jgi:hypothetical protein
MNMADEQFEEMLGRAIAVAITEAITPLRKRIELLEQRATTDQLKALETRLQRLETSDPGPMAKTLKLVHDGHG